MLLPLSKTYRVTFHRSLYLGFDSDFLPSFFTGLSQSSFFISVFFSSRSPNCLVFVYDFISMAMDKWENIQLSKEEEKGVTTVVEEVCGEEIFQRTLAGKLWTDNNFNTRAFTSTMISVWKLKNLIEI